MERSCGVLMHITSLPGVYGIGKFGDQAVDFARFLKSAGFTYWQVLPFGPVGSGNSPYQTYSAFAGYPGLIDPQGLVNDGLLYEYELGLFQYDGPDHTTDYTFANAKALDMMQFAFPRISLEMQSDINLFAMHNKEWLDDYALFMALKDRYDQKSFWDWPDKALICSDATAILEAFREEREAVAFWKFMQYIFFRQWTDTKKRINELGIKIIGDMPIYVSRDSSDLWASPSLFKLDQFMSPKVVAGVPPDFFARDGQLWGNPIYDWAKMEEDGFAWWIRRIKSALDTFDWVRIDHFRGFESYWEVPVQETTAVNGRWRKGPAMRLFDKVRAAFGNAAIIAEDLGDITDAVRKFLSDSGYPGMKIMQFAFDPYFNSEYLPHNYIPNSVAYTGTHDNNTTLGWLWSATEEERGFALEYCGFEKENWGDGGSDSASIRAVIRTLWQTSSNLTIVPIQDLCGFGSDARMNTPGTATGNWGFRLTTEALKSLSPEKWKQFNDTFKRTPESQFVKKISTRDDCGQGEDEITQPNKVK